MHTFLLLASPERLPPARIEQIATRSLPRLTFESDSELRWSSASGRCVVLGWQANTHLAGMGGHWDTSDDSLTAFTGWPLARGGGWARDRSWAAQVAEMVDPGAPGAAREHLTGVHSLVRLDSQGRGSVSSDLVGVGAPYIGRRGALTAVSSRADLVALSLAEDAVEPARDLEGVGWLPFFGLIVGNRTGFEGVETVPQGSWIQVADGSLALREWDSAVLGDLSPAVDAEWSESVDLALNDLESNIASIAAIDAPERVVMLSGGKDARLIVGLTLPSDSKAAFTFRTVGLDNQADVVVARLLAREFELDLEHAVPPQVWLDRPQLDQRLRHHAFQSSGMFGAWDLQGHSLVSPTLQANGLFGELMRSFYAKGSTLRSVTQVRRFFAEELPLDPAGILSDDAVDHYRGEIRTWVDRQLERGAAPGDLPDLFYLEQRMRRWVGAAREASQAGPAFYPLQSEDALRAAVRAGHERRRLDQLHFEFLRRTDSRLLEVPLANDVWNPDNYRSGNARFESTGVPNRPNPVRGAPGPASWQEVNWELITETLRSHVLEEPSNPIFSIVDRARLEQTLSGRRRLRLAGRVCLMATLSAAIWLARGEQRLQFPKVPPESAERRAERFLAEERLLRRRVIELEAALYRDGDRLQELPRRRPTEPLRVIRRWLHRARRAVNRLSGRRG